jgi:hypothetical protein
VLPYAPDQQRCDSRPIKVDDHATTPYTSLPMQEPPTVEHASALCHRPPEVLTSAALTKGVCTVYLTMNIKIMEAAMPANEKLVLLAIASHYNGPKHKNFICPGIDRLAAMTGLSNRSVERTFAWLKSQNCITIKRRRNNSNVYTICRGVLDLPRCVNLADPKSGSAKLADQEPLDPPTGQQDPPTCQVGPANLADYSIQMIPSRESIQIPHSSLTG